MAGFGSRRRKSASSPDEVEALQTDVMRFLAIICMCLMIVFSLVQSIPVSSSRGNKPKMSGKTLVEDEIEVLKEVARQLAEEIDVLENEVVVRQESLDELTSSLTDAKIKLKELDEEKREREKAVERTRKALADADALLADARRRTEATETRAAEARKKLNQELVDLNEVRKKLEGSRDASRKARTAVNEANQRLVDMRKAELEARRKLAEARAKAENQSKAARARAEAEARAIAKAQAEAKAKAKAEAEARAKAKAAAEARAKAEAEAKARAEAEAKKRAEAEAKARAEEDARKKAKAEKKGFTLGFTSNSALEHLLLTNQGVKLYLLAGGRSWRFTKTGGGKWKFSLSDAPRSIYEMDRSTVPDKVRRAGKKVVASFGKDGVAYGVTLPSDIRGEVTRLMTLHESGDIIIHKDGAVAMK